MNMDTLLKVLLVGLTAALFLLIGSIPAATAMKDGPGNLIFWGALVAGFAGAATALFAASLGARRETFVVGGCSAFVTFLPTLFVMLTGNSTADFQREMAPKVVSLASARFDELDANHNGDITDEEMKTALANLSLTGEERRVLEHMRTEQSEIGHVIDSYDTTTYVWIPIGDSGGGYLSPVTSTTYVYAINRQNLQGYLAKVTEKYKHW